MTGFFFHIASVTVRPNPSLIDFCSTTVDARTRALIWTIAEGRQQQHMDIGVTCGRRLHLHEHGLPFGIVGGAAAGQHELAVVARRTMR